MLRRVCKAELVGSSPAITMLREHVARVASSPCTTVLVYGESGAGKELVARAIHEQSARAGRRFVAINCSALSDTLLEAELFGYEGGAFTGADVRGREGLFAEAEGGTLFLDEIADLDPKLQARLLRVLQERVYRRVGGTEDRPMDLRIVAATNRDLEEMVDAGTFREDLFYRLNVLCLRVPALRERREDIGRLAQAFLDRCGRELGKRFEGFSPDALAVLSSHSWPGNVRELENTVERAALFHRSGPIEPGGLGLEQAREAVQADSLVLPMSDCSIKAMERVLIRRVLEETGGNRSRAARLLGVNRTTLYNKLRQYALE